MNNKWEKLWIKEIEVEKPSFIFDYAFIFITWKFKFVPFITKVEGKNSNLKIAYSQNAILLHSSVTRKCVYVFNFAISYLNTA